MASAYPAVVRAARHQLPPDAALYAHLGERAWMEATWGPNLVLVTGPMHACARGDCPIPDSEHPMLIPVLMLRAG